MSTTVRNSIILFVLFLIITLIGVFRIHIYSQEKLKNIEKINVEKKAEVKRIADKIKNYDLTMKAFEDIKTQWNKREKVLLEDEKGGETLLFLNNIASEKNSRVEFDFVFLGKENKGDYGFSRYSIKGEGTYYSVYGFINKIEEAKSLYKIKLLSMQSIEEVSENTYRAVTKIRYSFVLEVYYSDINEDYISNNKYSYEYKKPVINPFNPLIKKNLPKNINGLIEIEDASLEAISHDMVLVKDNKGRFRSLKAGDKVYLGYLTNINPEKGEAEFTLNKGGIIEKVILKIFTKS